MCVFLRCSIDLLYCCCWNNWDCLLLYLSYFYFIFFCSNRSIIIILRIFYHKYYILKRNFSLFFLHKYLYIYIWLLINQKFIIWNSLSIYIDQFVLFVCFLLLLFANMREREKFFLKELFFSLQMAIQGISSIQIITFMFRFHFSFYLVARLLCRRLAIVDKFLFIQAIIQSVWFPLFFCMWYIPFLLGLFNFLKWEEKKNLSRVEKKSSTKNWKWETTTKQKNAN